MEYACSVQSGQYRESGRIVLVLFSTEIGKKVKRAVSHSDLTSPLRPSPPGEGNQENACLGKGMNALPGGEATEAVQPKGEVTPGKPKKSSVLLILFPGTARTGVFPYVFYYRVSLFPRVKRRQVALHDLPPIKQIPPVFLRKKRSCGEQYRRSEKERKKGMGMPCEKCDVSLDAEDQKEIIYNGEEAYENGYEHQDEAVELKMNFRICRHGEDPLRPRMEFPEEVHIDEVIEGQAVFDVFDVVFSVEIEVHENGDE